MRAIYYLTTQTYMILSFAVSAICLYLGIVTFFRDKKAKLNILFSLVCLALALWSGLTAMAAFLNIYKLGVRLIETAYIGKYLFFPLNLHFCLILTRTNYSWKHLPFIYLPAIILITAQYMGHSIILYMAVYKDMWIGVLDFNYPVLLYGTYTTTCLIISYIIIIRWRNRSTINKDKIYSALILAMIAVSYLSALIMTIILPYYNIYDLQPLGLMTFYIYIFGVFFLISKLRFMNLNYALMTDEIIAHMNDMVVLLNTDMKILHVNNKFEKMFPSLTKDIRNKCFYDLIIESEELKKNISELDEKKTSNFTLRLTYKDTEEDIITTTYFSRLKDKYNDIIGFFIISTEVKEIIQFKKYFKITKREMEIIECIIAGCTYKDIARRFSISEKTVESHVTNIYNKLNVNNKIEMIKVTGDFNIKAPI